MNKKQLSGIIFIGVLAVIAFIFLLATGAFYGDKNSIQDGNNTSLSEGGMNSEKESLSSEAQKEQTVTSEEQTESETVSESISEADPNEKEYKFRNQNLLNQHYEKHGKDMGFSSAEEYEKAASAVVNNPDALHKIEKEDGDDIYYIEATNEFVVVSTDGYLRTYFYPDKGIDYFNKQ